MSARLDKLTLMISIINLFHLAHELACKFCIQVVEKGYLTVTWGSFHSPNYQHYFLFLEKCGIPYWNSGIIPITKLSTLFSIFREVWGIPYWNSGIISFTILSTLFSIFRKVWGIPHWIILITKLSTLFSIFREVWRIPYWNSGIIPFTKLSTFISTLFILSLEN